MADIVNGRIYFVIIIIADKANGLGKPVEYLLDSRNCAFVKLWRDTARPDVMS